MCESIDVFCIERLAIVSYNCKINPISIPERANFLRRMLDENEGTEKDQFLGDPDWLSEM